MTTANFSLLSPIAFVRISAAIFTLWLGLTVSTHWVIVLFVVLGQGHFLSAYFYKLHNRQVTIRGLILFIILTALLFGIYTNNPNLQILALVTQTYFMVHFLIDEKFLAGAKPSIISGLEMLSIVVLFVSFHLFDIYRLDAQLPALGLVAIILITYLVLIWKKQPKKSQATPFFLGSTLVLLGLNFLDRPIPFTTLIGMVILYHYFNWYITLFFRFRSNVKQFQDYLVIISLANFLAIGLYLIYRLAPSQVPYFGYFYSLSYFYLWTLVHLIFSTRARDFDYFTKLQGE